MGGGESEVPDCGSCSVQGGGGGSKLETITEKTAKITATVLGSFLYSPCFFFGKWVKARRKWRAFIYGPCITLRDRRKSK